MGTHLVFRPAETVKVGQYVQLPEARRRGALEGTMHRVYDRTFFPYSRTVCLFLEMHRTGCQFFAADEDIAVEALS